MFGRIAVGLALTAVLAAQPARAGYFEGRLHSFDPLARQLIMADRTITTVDPEKTAIPASMKAGDRIRVEFVSSGDNGIDRVMRISLITPTG